MRNPLISLALLSVCFGSVVLAACSAPDPGVGYLGLSHSGVAGGNAATVSDDAGAAGGGSGSGSGSGGGATPSPVGSNTPAPTPVADSGAAAGKDSGTPATDAGTTTAASFLGETTPYKSNPPATTAKQRHAAVGQAAQTPTTVCLGCHTAGGAGAPFLAAGFVATTAGGTTGAADVEVRVYATGGTAAGYSANTDTDGFFWINPPVGGTTGPYNNGIRTATASTLMNPGQTSLDCQSSTCHGGTQGPIHL